MDHKYNVWVCPKAKNHYLLHLGGLPCGLKIGPEDASYETGTNFYMIEEHYQCPDCLVIDQLRGGEGRA